MNTTIDATKAWYEMSLEEKLVAMLADLHRQRDAIDAALAGVRMLKALPREDVCIIDISRCPGLIAALRK